MDDHWIAAPLMKKAWPEVECAIAKEASAEPAKVTLGAQAAEGVVFPWAV